MRFHTLFVFLTLVFAINSAKKYRSEKINYIYEKALKHINDRQNIARLEKELTNYDGIYMDTKERHGLGKVDSLNKELTKVDKKLIMLLEKYGIENTLQAFKEKMKNKNTWQYTEENSVLPSDKFVDEKLQKLWQQAKDSKFTPAELNELHTELKEVERKMRVYDDHLEDFSKVPHENSVHYDSQDLSEKTKQLKIANKDMNEHLEKMHEKITNEQFSPFTETKVKRLWKLAQENTSFSIHDLNTLKEELLHFENQLKKVEFHQNEISEIKNLREAAGKSEIHNIEGAELDARHEKLSRKVRKLEKYLEAKISHTEL